MSAAAQKWRATNRCGKLLIPGNCDPRPVVPNKPLKPHEFSCTGSRVTLHRCKEIHTKAHTKRRSSMRFPPGIEAEYYQQHIFALLSDNKATGGCQSIKSRHFSAPATKINSAGGEPGATCRASRSHG